MILLDTHAWLWWRAGSSRLSRRAARAIDAADRLYVCSISCWEVAMLDRLGRIELDRPVADWVRQALAHPRVVAVSITPEIAMDAALLPEGAPADPADRLIYASASALGADLVTKDAALRRLAPRRAVW